MGSFLSLDYTGVPLTTSNEPDTTSKGGWIGNIAGNKKPEGILFFSAGSETLLFNSFPLTDTEIDRQS